MAKEDKNVKISKRGGDSLTPRRPMSVWDAMDKMLSERFFEPFESSLFHERPLFPKVDLSENKESIVIKANVPGIDPDNIDIQISDDTISISGTIDKEEEEGEKDSKFYRYEREYGTFRREFALPTKVDSSKVSAEAKNGVVSITLPKTEGGKPKKVKIDRK